MYQMHIDVKEWTVLGAVWYKQILLLFNCSFSFLGNQLAVVSWWLTPVTLQPNLSASLSGGDDIQASDCCPPSLALLLLLRKTWRNVGATELLSASLLMWCFYYYCCLCLHVPFLPFCRPNLVISCSSSLHLAGLEVGHCRVVPEYKLIFTGKSIWDC